MGYNEMLKETAEMNGSIVCVGLDPVLDRIPNEAEGAENKITNFYTDIIDAMQGEGELPGAFKPNYAFYAQYGFPGLRALENVIKNCREVKVPVVLDGKRGDIGKTSAAYAHEAFDFWRADCLTVAPYMGEDSVMPFVKWCEEKGRGIYVLNRTSNKGAVDFQNLKTDRNELYLHVAEKIIEWGKDAKGNVGAVVGATSTQELKDICKFYKAQDVSVPLLIPGVGAQGGSGSGVADILKNSGLELSLQRINSSSGINYAYEKQDTDDYAGAAVKALRELNNEIGFSVVG